MESHRPQVVLLTGASSGLGLALAHALTKLGTYRLALSARAHSVDLLRQHFIENEMLKIFTLDVTNPDDRRKTISEVETIWGGVDILINNAGISYRSVIEHIEERDFIEQFKTNFFGGFELTRLVLPSMRKKRCGRIINVSSVGGMMAMPTMGAYSASKFALEGATEALWYEMKPWNVKVVLIEPGFVHSNSFRKVFLTKDAKQSIANHDEYNSYYQHMSCFIEKLMELSSATPEKIAGKIIRAMQRANPPLRVHVTLDAYFFSLLRRLLPRRMYHWVLFRNLPGIKSWGK